MVSSVACANAGLATGDDERDDDADEREQALRFARVVTRVAPDASPGRLNSQTTTSPAKSVTWCASESAAVLPAITSSIDEPTRQATSADDDRQQARDPRRAPRREQEPDRERDVERAEVARGVHREPGIGAEDQRGHRDRDLHEREDREDPAERELRVIARGFGADGGEDRRA